MVVRITATRLQQPVSAMSTGNSGNARRFPRRTRWTTWRLRLGGKPHVAYSALCVSAALAFDRLQLAVSANLATEALQLARLRYGNHLPMSTFPATLLAQVAYEQGRFEEAEALLRPRLSVIRASGLLECVARASVLLARLALHRGRRGAALLILREMEALGRARRWPRLVSTARSEYARTVEILRDEEGQSSATYG